MNQGYEGNDEALARIAHIISIVAAWELFFLDRSLLVLIITLFFNKMYDIHRNSQDRGYIAHTGRSLYNHTGTCAGKHVSFITNHNDIFFIIISIGGLRRQELMWWGRRDTARGLDWVEIWGLDDVLTLFGFPEDETKLIPTTYIRNFQSDE